MSEWHFGGQNCKVFPRVESIRWSELKVFPESGKYQSGRGNDLYSTAVLSQAINSRVDPWDPSAGHNYTVKIKSKQLNAMAYGHCKSYLEW